MTDPTLQLIALAGLVLTAAMLASWIILAIGRSARERRRRREDDDRAELDTALAKMGESVRARNAKVAAKTHTDEEPPF